MRLLLFCFGCTQVIVAAGKESSNQHIEHFDNGRCQFFSTNCQKGTQLCVAFGRRIEPNIACAVLFGVSVSKS